MKDYQLTIQICSPVVEKLDYLSKFNSVLFVDYTDNVLDIFNCFTSDKEFNLFRFKLYTLCQEYVRIKKYSNWYRLESDPINITMNALATCLPKEIRRRYFNYDNFYEKYVPKEFNYHYI